MNLKRLFAMTLALSGACAKDRIKASGCRDDSECGEPASAWRCDIPSGSCYCRTDDACPVKEFCNAAGFCQDRAGCEKNADCQDASLFCDTSTGTCLSKGRCTLDLHCPLGQVCDATKSSCVDGCRYNGDCNGSSCFCGDVPCACNATSPAEVSKCTIGTCDPYACASPTFCKFGEQCGPVADAGTARNQCYSDFDPVRRPYCSNCSFGGGVSVCGTGPNYCLIDTHNPGNYFCGTDCMDGQACPRGYACEDVVVVFTQWACSKAAPACPGNPSLPCTQDKDCKKGGQCAIPSGATSGTCAGACSVAEGDTAGFCSCQVDDDCAQEQCSSGECSISRRKCVTDGDCRKIRCVDFEGVGGCLIGQNCAPANGLSCLEVQ